MIDSLESFVEVFSECACGGIAIGVIAYLIGLGVVVALRLLREAV